MASTKIMSFLERRFKLREHKTNVRTELLAGVTTFLAMSYILAVNPTILGAAGMDRGGVFFATVLAAALGTLLMALLANYPFGLAPAMGLNAYFAYTVVGSMGYSWQFALFAVFCEGLIFLILSVSTIREQIFNAIPLPLKRATGVGIGLFITMIALQNAHLIVGHKVTLITLFQFSQNSFHAGGIQAVLAIVGVLVTAWLLQKKVFSAILLGIIATWVLGIIAQIIGIYQVVPEIGNYSLLPDLSLSSMKGNIEGFFGLFGSAFGVESWTRVDVMHQGWDLLFSMNFIVIVFAFLFVDLFSALGTLTGVASQGGMLDKDGKLPRIRGAFMADSLATSAGAIFGTSTTSSYVESAAGVVEGGRTGLASVFTSVLFISSLILAPLFLAIPAFATAPALIVVGFFMMQQIKDIDFSDMGEAVPAFLTMVIMPFSYSIIDGISVGIVSWTLLNFALKKKERVSLLMVILSVLFVLKYALL